jgi:hypothetical protein
MNQTSTLQLLMICGYYNQLNMLHNEESLKFNQTTQNTNPYNNSKVWIPWKLELYNRKENCKKIGSFPCYKTTLIAYNVKNLNKGEIYGSEEMLERYDNFYEHKNGNI